MKYFGLEPPAHMKMVSGAAPPKGTQEALKAASEASQVSSAKEYA